MYTYKEHNDYIHLKMNHSLNFKDPEIGAHTNQIESKKSLPNTNRCTKMFAGYLATFMLRTKWKGEDGFKLFMKYAAKLYSEDSITEETEAKCLKST
ncbi:Uncharacterized protein APZ42_027697 [Daphnia magna]|uniref:Uncharacterized protein n=1 Tax=Daphnia magna TaxID=35525 RepID=A0A164R788_9CRUS|nr:Uncharacterized protein APZ42_027697 [Daphnia magna]